jgi:PAS domain S-box-containing protein
MFYIDDMSVEKVMTQEYSVLPLDADISLVIKCFIKNDIEDLYVLNNKDKKLVGVIHRDKVFKQIKKLGLDVSGYNIIAVDIMDTHFKYIGQNTDINDCIKIMKQSLLKSIPIVKDGIIKGVVWYLDILRYLLKQYRNESKMFDKVLNDIQEAVCIIDKSGRVIFWNNSSERLYDLPQDIILGNNLGDYFPNAINLKVLKSKKIVKDVVHSPREGTNIIISASPIMIDGECAGVISTDKDISEIKRINGELEKARERAGFLENEINRLTGKWGNIYSKNKKMQNMMEVAKRAAPSKASIMISGESGTGKEVFARTIHSQSGMKGSFVPVNCSAIPAELFESEFFGYESGAFTGASRQGKAGFFEMADKGTLFLDEIGDLPLSMQSKLLRAVEEMKIKRVGGERYIDVDVRIISATNKNLEECVKKGTFREDLYYRLNVIKIVIPPLRERKEDIYSFLRLFLNETCKKEGRENIGIDRKTVRILTEYPWKGNVRELKNVAESMAILCQKSTITTEDIPEQVMGCVSTGRAAQPEEDTTLREAINRYEKSLIMKTLRNTGGNISKAAEKLGLPRSTLYYKMENYNIDVTKS